MIKLKHVFAYSLRFSASARDVRLREFSAQFLGIRLRGRGAVHLPPGEAASASPSLTENPIAVAMQAIENAPDWVLRHMTRPFG